MNHTLRFKISRLSRVTFIVLSMKREPFVEILKSDFEKRRKRNTAYSLRSFSRDLEVDASNLSKILSYQKAIGKKLRLKLATKIGFSELDMESFELKCGNEIEDAKYASHALDVFELVSRSYHYVILELFKMPDFDGDPKSIASMIGITQKEAKEALIRLKQVGLIKELGDGQLVPADNSSSNLVGQSTSRSHREQQKEILESAIDALDEIPIEQRSQSSMTMAIDSSKLAEARDLIKTFRRKMGRLLSNSPDLDKVYQLSIALYPVSKSAKELK